MSYRDRKKATLACSWKQIVASSPSHRAPSSARCNPFLPTMRRAGTTGRPISRSSAVPAPRSKSPIFFCRSSKSGRREYLAPADKSFHHFELRRQNNEVGVGTDVEHAFCFAFQSARRIGGRHRDRFG